MIHPNPSCDDSITNHSNTSNSQANNNSNRSLQSSIPQLDLLLSPRRIVASSSPSSLWNEASFRQLMLTLPSPPTMNRQHSRILPPPPTSSSSSKTKTEYLLSILDEVERVLQDEDLENDYPGIKAQ